MKRLLACMVLLLLPCLVYANDQRTDIFSPYLYWQPSTKTYHFEGGVTVQQDGKTLQADEVFYQTSTDEAHAIGDVRYRDHEVEIHAQKARLNIKKNTGTLSQGRLFFLRGNYRLKARLLERLSEHHYRGKDISYTTCTGRVTFWCLKASRADLVIGRRIRATHVRLHILGIPVFYTPYLWAPVLTERTTGFLMPRFGYNSERGAEISLPFYLVISENRDATFYLDWAERSLGQGLEYRYIERHIGRGEWFVYRLRDRSIDRVFYSLKALHRLDRYAGMGGFLSVNYLSDKDYYRLYSHRIELFTSRFTASTAEVYYRNYPYKVYLRTRYWQNLTEARAPVQHLPLLGLLVYPKRFGPFLAGFQAEAGRFYQKDGIEAYRVELLPYLSHNTGTLLRLQQSAVPFLAHYRIDGKERDSYGLSYHADLSSTFYSRTQHLLHTITPEISYDYRIRRDMPGYVFDEEEAPERLSELTSGLLQRFYLDGTHLGALRLYYTRDLQGDEPSRLVLEGYKTGNLNIKFDITYDTEASQVSKYHYQIGIGLEWLSLSGGESYSRSPEIKNYQGNISLKPLHYLTLRGGVWYDEIEGSFTKISYGATIDGQCASLNLTYSRTQTQYSIFVLLNFKGLGQVRYGQMSEEGTSLGF